MEQKVYQLSEICEIKSGKRIPKDMRFVEVPTNHPYIRARDIKDGKIRVDSLIYLEDKVYEKIKKYIICSDDIAITIVGASVGDIAYAQTSVNGYNLTENAVRLTNFNNKVHSKYLFYMLFQKQYKDFMQLIAGAAAQPKLGIYKIQKIKVKLPDFPEQKRIASVLSAYDDLIEKNNRKIQILQDMAEELYKEWFVRFRFPGHETATKKESALGNIPNSFNVIKMADIFDNYIGGGWGNDDENKQYSIPAYVIRGTDFPSITKGDISTCPYRWHKESNYKSRQLKPNDIVIEISGGTAEQPVGRAILVDDNLIKRFDNKVICASFCKQVSLKQDKISPIYFYYWMKFLYDTRMIDRFQLQSTGIINFKFEYFVRKGDVLLPPKSLMDKFDNIVTTMRKDISHLAEQNNILKQQRNLLLPRLMSGKHAVKVS